MFFLVDVDNDLLFFASVLKCISLFSRMIKIYLKLVEFLIRWFSSSRICLPVKRWLFSTFSLLVCQNMGCSVSQDRIGYRILFGNFSTKKCNRRSFYFYQGYYWFTEVVLCSKPKSNKSNLDISLKNASERIFDSKSVKSFAKQIM